VKVVTRPAHHSSYNYFNAVFICFDLAAVIKIEIIVKCKIKNKRP
jgi:hypothetical protein